MEKVATPNDVAPGIAGKIIPFHQWVPYAIAACLMSLGIWQTLQILALKSQLATIRAETSRLQKSNALIGLQLTTLEPRDETAKDPFYATSKIMIAWDPYQYRGIVAPQNLRPSPAGHDYQLWVLDPEAETPVSAGLLTSARPFSVKWVSTQNPGFAISLEPSGGSPVPTSPILFAVAPGL